MIRIPVIALTLLAAACGTSDPAAALRHYRAFIDFGSGRFPQFEPAVRLRIQQMEAAGATVHSFADDLAFLREHTEIVVLSSEDGSAQVAVAPAGSGHPRPAYDPAGVLSS